MNIPHKINWMDLWKVFAFNNRFSTNIVKSFWLNLSTNIDICMVWILTECFLSCVFLSFFSFYWLVAWRHRMVWFVCSWILTDRAAAAENGFDSTYGKDLEEIRKRREERRTKIRSWVYFQSLWVTNVKKWHDLVNFLLLSSLFALFIYYHFYYY